MGEKKCALTDAELYDTVQKWVSKLCDTGGSAWTLSVPVNFDHDPDMLITELCKRQSSLLARHNALVEAVEKTLEAYDSAEGFSKPYCRDEFAAARAEVDRLLSGDK